MSFVLIICSQNENNHILNNEIQNNLILKEHERQEKLKEYLIEISNNPILPDRAENNIKIQQKLLFINNQLDMFKDLQELLPYTQFIENFSNNPRCYEFVRFQYICPRIIEILSYHENLLDQQLNNNEDEYSSRFFCELLLRSFNCKYLETIYQQDVCSLDQIQVYTSNEIFKNIKDKSLEDILKYIKDSEIKFMNQLSLSYPENNQETKLLKQKYQLKLAKINIELIQKISLIYEYPQNFMDFLYKFKEEPEIDEEKSTFNKTKEFNKFLFYYPIIFISILIIYVLTIIVINVYLNTSYKLQLSKIYKDGEEKSDQIFQKLVSIMTNLYEQGNLIFWFFIIATLGNILVSIKEAKKKLQKVLKDARSFSQIDDQEGLMQLSVDFYVQNPKLFYTIFKDVRREQGDIYLDIEKQKKINNFIKKIENTYEDYYITTFVQIYCISSMLMIPIGLALITYLIYLEIRTCHNEFSIFFKSILITLIIIILSFIYGHMMKENNNFLKDLENKIPNINNKIITIIYKTLIFTIKCCFVSLILNNTKNIIIFSLLFSILIIDLLNFQQNNFKSMNEAAGQDLLFDNYFLSLTISIGMRLFMKVILIYICLFQYFACKLVQNKAVLLATNVIVELISLLIFTSNINPILSKIFVSSMLKLPYSDSYQKI